MPTLEEELNGMEESEIPPIDMEMAIQRKYPELEHMMIDHGKQEKKSFQEETDQPQLVSVGYDPYTNLAMAKFSAHDMLIGWSWLLSDSPEWSINGQPVESNEIDQLLSETQHASATLSMAAVNALNKKPEFVEALKESLGSSDSSDSAPTVLQAQKLRVLARKTFIEWFNR